MEVLVTKTIAAAKQQGQSVIAVSGGVSCNTRLREVFTQECERSGLELLLAEPSLCTDNAAMIAHVGSLMLAEGVTSKLTAEIDPNLKLVG